jgi:hypothetical protein
MGIVIRTAKLDLETNYGLLTSDEQRHELAVQISFALTAIGLSEHDIAILTVLVWYMIIPTSIYPKNVKG